MFHDIPEPILNRMSVLEKIDGASQNGTPMLQRLRQVPAETGKLLALMLASAPKGVALEIGTSAGYSTLWLALACRATGKQVTTFEVLDEKVSLAKETFRKAEVEDVVKLVKGDARKLIANYHEISFCFLDSKKNTTLTAMRHWRQRWFEAGYWSPTTLSTTLKNYSRS